MEMFTSRSNYKYLSDAPTFWQKNKGCEISFKIYPNGKELSVTIPITTNYKYLGAKISRNLKEEPQIRYLQAKSNFIINAFKATKIASQDMKFCLNTWQLFIRPLLDYSQALFSFPNSKDRLQLEILYRQTVRKMLFMTKTTPTAIIDQLIQYNYKTLHNRFKEIASKNLREDFSKMSITLIFA